MARYVVTGGFGFIGKELVSQLLRLGHEVIVGGRTRAYSVGCEGWIEYDLRSVHTVHNVLNTQADGVFHLAWATSPAIAESDPAFDISTNLGGTISLLEGLAKHHPVPIVLLSSGGTVYGDAGEKSIPEDYPLNPISIYGMTKASMEKYASSCTLFSGLDVRIARVSNPFGSGQAPEKMQGAATIFTRKVLRGDPISIWGDGKIIRDFVDVKDVAAALIAIMSLKFVDYASNMVFNVGSGEGWTLIDLIKFVEDCSGVGAHLDYRASRSFDVKSNVLNINKLLAMSDWKPRPVRDRLRVLVAALASDVQ